MSIKAAPSIVTIVLVSALALGVNSPRAQGDENVEGSPRPTVSMSLQSASRSKAMLETTARSRARNSLYFQRNWGVDLVGVRRVSSGLMLRFDYRVVDSNKAMALVDRKSRPYLVDEATGTVLAIPAMENIGELRQVAPLEESRTYFMIFGNPGALVKPGGHVTVVVGNFRAVGMVVGQ